MLHDSLKGNSGSKPVFGQLEAMSACANLSLTLVDFGRYLVVMRSAFDVTISGEPYLALMLLMDMESGNFVARIWNQTVTRGSAVLLEEFVEACETFFARNERPCLGLPEAEDCHHSQDFLISQTPVPRKISTSCQRMIRRESGDRFKSCRECLKLLSDNDSKDTDNVECKAEVFPPDSIEPKIELVEEGDEVEYDDESFLDHLEDSTEDKSLLADISSDDRAKVETSQCPKCSHSFKFKAYLRVHMMTEHFRGVFKCPHCNFKAFYAQELVEHMSREGHPGDGDLEVRCPRCQDTLPLLDAESHFEKCATLDSVKCCWCPRTFPKAPGLQSHIRSVHLAGLFKCSQCPLKFNVAGDLLRHARDEGHLGDGQVSCAKCKERVPAPQIESHYEECLWDTENGSEFCDQVPKHQRCPFCKAFYRVGVRLDYHMKSEHFWGAFRCTQCEFKADFASELKGHIEREKDHQGLKEVLCPQCRSMHALSQIQDHYKDCVSELAKDRKCPWCEKKFRRHAQDTMLEHKKKQHFWGEFRCSRCSFHSDFARELVQHAKVQHDHEGDDLLVDCPDCSQKFPCSEIDDHYKSCVFVGLKCPWCVRKFSGMGSTFNDHRKREHCWGIFRCPECQHKSHFAKELVEHMEQEGHLRDQLINCFQCKDAYKVLELEAHYATCVKSNFKCQWCDTIFKGSSGAYDSHRKKKHFWGNFRCPACSFRCHFAQDLVDHMHQELHHVGDPLVSCPHCSERHPFNEVGGHYVTCVSGKGWKMGRCSRCRGRFPKQDLPAHEDGCFVVKREKIAVGKLVPNPVGKTNSGGPKYEWTCPICFKTLLGKNSGSIHKKTVHFMDKFHCPQCYKREDFAAGLVDHMAREGHMEPFVKCPNCGEKCDTLGLDSHYKECVSKKKAVPKVCCETCGKVVQVAKLKEHNMIHLRAESKVDDASLYDHCDRCGKRFASKQGLRHHIMVVHEGVKINATCGTCGLSFDTQTKLQNHKVSRGPD